MFEAILAPLLERALGTYVEDLPRERVRVGLWSGVVRLENVRLKPDAFDALGLPFAVRSGTASLLELRVSWKTALLRVHPVVVAIEGVSLLASPRAEDEWIRNSAPEERARALRDATTRAAAEAATTAKRGGGGISGGVLHAMWAPILERLQLKIEDVRVRFVDLPSALRDDDATTTTTAGVASFGMRVEALHVRTESTQDYLRRIMGMDVARASASASRASASDDSDDAGGDGGDVVGVSTTGRFRDGESAAAAKELEADAKDLLLSPLPPRGGGGVGRGGGRRRERRRISTVRGLLSVVAPVTEARKHLEVIGFEVYGKPAIAADVATRSPMDRFEWHPAETLQARVEHTPAARDDHAPEDVMLAASNLTASIHVVAAPRTRPARGDTIAASSSSSSSSNGGGFDVHVQLHDEIRARVRPSQVRALVRLSDAMDVWALRSKHGARRPTDASRGLERDWSAWWKYAIEATIRDNDDAKAAVRGGGESDVAMKKPAALRYLELYSKKLRERLRAESEDDDENDGETFYECEDGDVDIGSEMSVLEDELTLEELLDARLEAERCLPDGDDDEWYDLDDDLDEDSSGLEDVSDDDDDDDDAENGSSTRGTISWAASALFRAPGRVLSGVGGVAARMSGGGGDARGRRQSRGAAKTRTAAFTLRVARVAVTLCAEAGDVVADVLRLELTKTKAELGVVADARRDAHALHVEVDDVAGYLLGGGEVADERAMWRRKDVKSSSSTAPFVRVSQRAPVVDAHGAARAQALDIAMAPFAVVAHPSAVSALVAFDRQTTGYPRGYGYLRKLWSVRELPGDAPRERLARAMMAVKVGDRVVPWSVSMSDALVIVPRADATTAAAAAAAIEVGAFRIEWSPGGGHAIDAREVDDLIEHARALSLRDDANEETNDALCALERVGTSHEVTASFEDVAMSAPIFSGGGGGGGGGGAWAPLFDGWSGSAAALMHSFRVGGPRAALRSRVRLAPLRVTLTPSLVASFDAIERAFAVVADAAAASGPPPPPPDFEVVESRDAADVDFTFAGLTVCASDESSSVVHRVEIARLAARAGISREGDARARVELSSVDADVCDGVSSSSRRRRLARVNCSEDGAFAPVLHVDASFSGSGGRTALEIDARGLDVSIESDVVAALAAFAAAAATAKSRRRASSSSSKETTLLAMTSFSNRRRAKPVRVPPSKTLLAHGVHEVYHSTAREDLVALSAPGAFDAPPTRSPPPPPDAANESLSVSFATRAPFTVALSDAGGVDPVLRVAMDSAKLNYVKPRDDDAKTLLAATIAGLVAKAPARARGDGDDVALLRLGVALTVETPIGSTRAAPSVEISVGECRVGAHAGPLMRAARWGEKVAAAAAAAAPPPPPPPSSSVSIVSRDEIIGEGVAPPSPRALACGSISLSLTDTSVFVPAPPAPHRKRGGGARAAAAGLFLAIDALDASTRLPFDPTRPVDADARLARFATRGVRVSACAEDDRERALSLLAAEPMGRSSSSRAGPAESPPPALATIRSASVFEERASRGIFAFACDVPSVAATLSPSSVALCVDALNAATAAVSLAREDDTPGGRRKAAAGTAESSAPVSKPSSKPSSKSPRPPLEYSVSLRLGRASLLLQSSKAAREGVFGFDGSERAGVVAINALSIKAAAGAERGMTSHKIDVSFHSAHATDVSATAAGEAERIALGVALGERFVDGGTPLAWIGGAGSGGGGGGGAARPSTSTLTARALTKSGATTPSSVGVDAALGGGGFACNLPAWNRVIALCDATAVEASRPTKTTPAAGGATKTKTKTKTKTAAAAGDVVSSSSASSFAGDDALFANGEFSTGEWVLTLPWHPPKGDGGPRAVRVLLDARASGTANVNTRTMTPTRWDGCVGVEKLKLDVTEVEPPRAATIAPGGVAEPAPPRVRAHALAELRGLKITATREENDAPPGGERATDVSVDVTARDVSVAASTRRLLLLGELRSLMEVQQPAAAAAAATVKTTRAPSATADQTTPKTPSAASTRSSTPTSVFASASVDVIGVLILSDDVSDGASADDVSHDASAALDVNLGVPLLEAAVLGLTASFTSDASSDAVGRETSIALNAEARVILDSLNQRKGAWEPIVEPWKVRLVSEASLRDDTASKASIKVVGYDALEITATEAGAASVAQCALAIANGAGDESAETAATTTATQGQHQSYWLRNATNATVRYWLADSSESESEPSLSSSSRGGSVPPGGRAPLHFPELKSRAAPRYSCVAGVRSLTSPAPPPPPAPTRAVVLRFEGAEEASAPVGLDELASHVLGERLLLGSAMTAEKDDDDGADANAANADAGRVVAEVRRVNDMSVRTELLLRSDLAVHNGTLGAVDLAFDGAGDAAAAADASSTVRVAPGQRVWLPPRRARARASVRWRPSDGNARAYAWSDPLPLRALAPSRETSAAPRERRAAASASDDDASFLAAPFRCLVDAETSPWSHATIVSLAPPLRVSNDLPVPLSISVSSEGGGGEGSAGGGSGSIVIAPGATIALHDAAAAPRAAPTLHMRPHGYTHCASVPLPAIGAGNGAKAGSAAAAAAAAAAEPWTAHRDVFKVVGFRAGGPRAPRLTSTSPVSVQLDVRVDERGTRCARVSCPVRVVNAASDALVLQAVDPPEGAEEEEFFEKLALDDGDAACVLGARLPSRTALGDGDCWLPPARPRARGLGGGGGADGVDGRGSDPPAMLPGLGLKRARASSSSSLLPLSPKLARSQDRLAAAASMDHTPTGSRPGTAPGSPDSGRSLEHSPAGSSGYLPGLDGGGGGGGGTRGVTARALFSSSLGVSAGSPTSSPNKSFLDLSDLCVGLDAATSSPRATATATATTTTRVGDASPEADVGVAMYGKHQLWGQSKRGVPVLVRARSPAANTWSSVVALNPGDARVVRCPAAAGGGGGGGSGKPSADGGACYEYVVSLRDPHSGSGTIVVQPRVVIRASALCGELPHDVPLLFREHGGDDCASLRPGEETPVTRWRASGGARAVCFRPNDGGVWSWSSPAVVDVVGVTYVKVRSLTRAPPARDDVGGSGGGAAKKLGFDESFDESFDDDGVRASSSAARFHRTNAIANAKTTRVFCVAVSSASSARGGFVVDVSELSDAESRALAPVLVENASNVVVTFRQTGAPRRHDGDERAHPRSTTSFLWDDPAKPRSISLSVPGAASPDICAPASAMDELDDDANDGGTSSSRWSAQSVVRYVDPSRPPVLLRVTTRRDAGATRVTIEAVDAKQNPSAWAAATAAAAATDAAAAATPPGGVSTTTAVTAPSSSSSSSPAFFTASPMTTRVLQPLLPRRLRPIAVALAFATDKASAAAAKSSAGELSSRDAPSFAIDCALELSSVGLSVVSGGGRGGARELLYSRATAVRLEASASGHKKRGGKVIWKDADVGARVGRVRADLQTAGASSNPMILACGGGGGAVLGGRGGGEPLYKPTGKRALSLRAAVGKQRRHEWALRSVALDVAPVTLDLKEELLLALPGIVEGFARPFSAVSTAVSTTTPGGALSTPHRGRLPTTTTPESTRRILPTLRPAAARALAAASASASMSVPAPPALASVRVGEFDLTVSFTALPFLPWGLRSLGAVDRARVSLGSFQLPSPYALRKMRMKKSNAAGAAETWSTDQVVSLARRHYIAEAAGQAGRLIASNKLLGDPARFLGEIRAATRELFASNISRGIGRRCALFSSRCVWAVGVWARTTLAHARDVAHEVEARFEASRERRVLSLRERRIEEEDEDGGGGGDGDSKKKTTEEARAPAGASDAVVVSSSAGAGGSSTSTLKTLNSTTKETSTSTSSSSVKILPADDATSAAGRPTSTTSTSTGGVEENDESKTTTRAADHPKDVVSGMLRALGKLVEAPLQGVELRGLPGLVEGAMEGVAGATANLAAASLKLAIILCDKAYAVVARASDGGDDLESVSITAAAVGGGLVITRHRVSNVSAPRLRPPRPAPSDTEPLLPFNGELALTREMHQYASDGKYAKAAYLGGAAIVKPRGGYVVVTSEHVVVGVAVIHKTPLGSSDRGSLNSLTAAERDASGEGAESLGAAATEPPAAAKPSGWVVRDAFPLREVVGVRVAGALVLITARYAPSRTSRDDDGFRSSLEGVESLLTPAYSAASRVAAAWRRGFLSRRFAAAGRREKNKNDAGSGRDGANAPRVNNSAVDVDAIPTREVALHCVDAVAAARLHGQLVAATTTTNGGGGGNALQRQ